jgi:hypothetical protein
MSARLGYLGLIMIPHFKNATGKSAFSNSRAATRRNLSRIHVASGNPERSAASRKAFFSASDTRSSIYSSRGFLVFGRPGFAMELLYQQKSGECNFFLDKSGFCGYSNGMN